jgi:hypothetical protein
MLRSYEPFLRAPYDQFAETRSGINTGFNFLTGVGGFLQVFEYGYSGLRFGNDAIQLDPSLSPQLHGVTLNNLQWQGRVFTVTIGPQSTQLHLTSGPALPVQTPSGSQPQTVVATGETITMPTRRPDLQPTSDLARCQAVSASSFIPGDEPVAAVDGSTATPWEATNPQATLTVQLSQTTSIRSVTVTRGSTTAFGYKVETSTDGSSWKVVATAPSKSTGTDQFTIPATQAQFVRLEFPGRKGAAAPEIDELSVSQ